MTLCNKLAIKTHSFCKHMCVLSRDHNNNSQLNWKWRPNLPEKYQYSPACHNWHSLQNREKGSLSQHNWSGHKWSGGTIYIDINGPPGPFMFVHKWSGLSKIGLALNLYRPFMSTQDSPAGLFCVNINGPPDLLI